ncbi:HRDC domain-containing protein [Rothia sp. AR01]|uniref:HRDC domain-containing protein n=1 Tax=Rothia santali TaxID=2949643 RepID=A0A9X2HK22_9MICC|nr:HRDC domain-containing protein [Rothia santali]MCP3425728.1 HRDC domain-containing protein [Rothia santali]
MTEDRQLAAADPLAYGENSLTSAEELGLDPDLSIPEVVRLDAPFAGIPEVVDTPRGLDRAAEILGSHEGPAAIDTERASGIRYGQRPFLVQIKRGDSPILLVDPEAFEDLGPLDDALADAEWIVHASTQDLPSLRQTGMRPRSLFDTELAGRLAGLARVSLGAMTEEILGYRLAKEHSAADWSQRPLPRPWLNYAALDVELLRDLRDAIAEMLEGQGKLAWAEEEFEALCSAPDPAQDPERWRKTKGLRALRSPQQLTALRNLWWERDNLAQAKDIAPKRLLGDAALVAAARALPRSVPALQRIPGFHTKLIKRESVRWTRAVQEALADPDPAPVHLPSTGPPPVKAWAAKRPDAARALAAAREELLVRAERLEVPQENLLTPDHLRRLCWEHAGAGAEEIEETLRELGAREWQIRNTVPLLVPAMAGRTSSDTAGTD